MINKYLLFFTVAATTITGYLSYLLYRISPFAFGSVVYYCKSAVSSVLEYLPFAGTFFFLLFVLVRIKLWRRQMNYIYSLPQLKSSKKLCTAITHTNVASPVYVFKHKEPLAFCYGTLKPSIYLSSSLIKLMTPGELQAVLLHEDQHIRQHDTRIITMMCTVSWIFFPFPFFQELTSAYSTEQEIHADQNVYNKTKTFANLKAALKKLLSSPISTPLPTFALPFTGYQAYAARIYAIQGTPVTITIPYNALYLSLVSLGIFSAMLLMPVNKTEYTVNNTRVIVMCYDNQSCELSCVNREFSQKLSQFYPILNSH